jgi:hypothetical protein
MVGRAPARECVGDSMTPKERSSTMLAKTRPNDSTHKRDSRRRRIVLLISTVAVLGTLVGSPLAAQGIIMRDGGVCDPIRHMGC